jgi:hypothetical protein
VILERTEAAERRLAQRVTDIARLHVVETRRASTQINTLSSKAREAEELLRQERASRAYVESLFVEAQRGNAELES